jgi:hypothetical protein
MTETSAGSDPDAMVGGAQAAPDKSRQRAARGTTEPDAGAQRRSALVRFLAIRLLPSSSLNFLSGLLAGAGINLLTGIVGGSSGTNYIPQIEEDSAVWVLASILAAAAAHIAEQADQKANLAITPDMSRQLKETIIRDEVEQVALKFWIIVGLALIATLAGILLVPGLKL